MQHWRMTEFATRILVLINSLKDFTLNRLQEVKVARSGAKQKKGKKQRDNIPVFHTRREQQTLENPYLSQVKQIPSNTHPQEINK